MKKEKGLCYKENCETCEWWKVDLFKSLNLNRFTLKANLKSASKSGLCH